MPTDCDFTINTTEKTSGWLYWWKVHSGSDMGQTHPEW